MTSTSNSLRNKGGKVSVEAEGSTYNPAQWSIITKNREHKNYFNILSIAKRHSYHYGSNSFFLLFARRVNTENWLKTGRTGTGLWYYQLAIQLPHAGDVMAQCIDEPNRVQWKVPLWRSLSVLILPSALSPGISHLMCTQIPWGSVPMQSLIQQIWGETWDLHLTSSSDAIAVVPCLEVSLVSGTMERCFPVSYTTRSVDSQQIWIDGWEKLEGNISVRGHSRAIAMPLTIGSSFKYWIPTMCQALVKTSEDK